MAITRAPWREHPCKVPICSGTDEIREERFIFLSIQGSSMRAIKTSFPLLVPTRLTVIGHFVPPECDLRHTAQQKNQI